MKSIARYFLSVLLVSATLYIFSDVTSTVNNGDKFSYAVNYILENEGGYANSPYDMGGETKYGISKRSYPNLNIDALTKEDAVNIYYNDWWILYGYDKINSRDVATRVLDISVLMGPSAAHRVVQRAANNLGANISIDGIIGTETLNAINTLNEDNLIREIKHESAYYLWLVVVSNPNQRVNFMGWLNRIYK